ncbi:MAG: DUF4124 domain-containing protein [Casimicrobiaceae bacterium]
MSVTLWARLRPGWRFVGLKPGPQDAASIAALAILLCFGASASAQSIFKCKGADGRITYSNKPCEADGVQVPLNSQGPAAAAPASAAPPQAGGAPGAGEDAKALARTSLPPLPKQCDNAAQLQSVVARLDSTNTPNDIRDFLADERFRLLRCEFTRFSAEERRDRDALMRDLESRDAARRRAAILRIEALYDHYLTPAERTARARNR